MSSCPRRFTTLQIIQGLKGGKVFVVDRRDAPELIDLFALEELGLVEQQFVEIDEQSSAVRWRWKEGK